MGERLIRGAVLWAVFPQPNGLSGGGVTCTSGWTRAGFVQGTGTALGKSRRTKSGVIGCWTSRSLVRRDEEEAVRSLLCSQGPNNAYFRNTVDRALLRDGQHWPHGRGGTCVKYFHSLQDFSSCCSQFFCAPRCDLCLACSPGSTFFPFHLSGTVGVLTKMELAKASSLFLWFGMPISV